MSPAIDLAFPIVQGLTVPIDHGHCLLGALKKAAPALAEIVPLGVIPLRGQPLPANLLHLPRGARLRLRIKPDAIPLVLPLAGKELRVGSHLIRLGSPAVEMLTPHPILAARLVMIAKTVPKAERTGDVRVNRFATEAEVLAAVKAKVNEQATVRSLGHRSLMIHGTRIAGYGVVVEGLDTESSLRLQSEGVGGRRSFGCGLFVAAGPMPRGHVVTASAGDEVGHA